MSLGNYYVCSHSQKAFCHSNTNIRRERTALHDHVRMEAHGCGDRVVTRQRDKITVSLVILWTFLELG